MYDAVHTSAGRPDCSLKTFVLVYILWVLTKFKVRVQLQQRVNLGILWQPIESGMETIRLPELQYSSEVRLSRKSWKWQHVPKIPCSKGCGYLRTEQSWQRGIPTKYSYDYKQALQNNKARFWMSLEWWIATQKAFQGYLYPVRWALKAQWEKVHWVQDGPTHFLWVQMLWHLVFTVATIPCFVPDHWARIGRALHLRIDAI